MMGSNVRKESLSHTEFKERESTTGKWLWVLNKEVVIKRQLLRFPTVPDPFFILVDYETFLHFMTSDFRGILYHKGDHQQNKEATY